jgi:single-strand DNA-binding protein
MSSHSNVNKVILIGNLGSAPELRTTGKGTTVANLSLATNRSIKQADGTFRERTVWHRVVVWGKRAEACGKYLDKGNRVYLEGTLQTHEWQDKDGQKRVKTEILVDEIKFLSVRSMPSKSGSAPEEVALAG